MSISFMTANLARQVEQRVSNSIDDKHNEMDEISKELASHQHNLQRLRVKANTSSKTVDLTELRPMLEECEKSLADYRNMLGDKVQSLDFSYFYQNIKKVDIQKVENLIDEIEGAKRVLQNKPQSMLMEIEAQLMQMKTVLEIARYILRQQQDSASNWINRVSR